MTRPQRATLVELARAVAVEQLTDAGLADAAIRNMDQARGHLRASNNEAGGGGHGDPTGEQAISGHRDVADDDHRRYARNLRHIAALAKENHGILANWNPTGEGVAADHLARIWCANHSLHGIEEVARTGRTNCEFCDDFKRRYGSLPGKQLLDMRGTRRLTSADFQREVQRQREAARAARGKATTDDTEDRRTAARTRRAKRIRPSRA